MTTVREGVAEAISTPKSLRRRVSWLVDQIVENAVLPVIGAGASFDCGLPTGGALAQQLYAKALEPLPAGDKPSDIGPDANLGQVADAVALSKRDPEIIDLIGLNHRSTWPAPDEVPEHFCAYRVLARLTREGLIRESVTFNYDCFFEGALLQEGFRPGPACLTEQLWPQTFSTAADAETNAHLARRGDFALTKAHGCVDRYRRATDKDRAAGDLVIRWRHLLDWRDAFWARDMLADRARRHVLLLLGFSAQDPVIHASLASALDEVLSEATGQVSPRVRVIDKDPETLTLRMLISSGAGKHGALPGHVSAVRSDPTKRGGTRLSTVLLLMLVALVWMELEKEARRRGIRLRHGQLARIVAVGLTGPAMMRWTYRILSRVNRDYWSVDTAMSRAKTPHTYYAPLLGQPGRTLAALQCRDRLRRHLRIAAERDPTIHAEQGFLVRRAFGYMPLGLDASELEEAAKRKVLSDLVAELRAPKTLEHHVVALDATDSLRVFSVRTQEEVSLLNLAVRRIVERLASVEFVTGTSAFAPLGQELPLVKAWAWDPHAAMLAVIAHGEAAHQSEDDDWHELLFAVSSLRHHLPNDGGAPAFAPQSFWRSFAIRPKSVNFGR